MQIWHTRCIANTSQAPQFPTSARIITPPWPSLQRNNAFRPTRLASLSEYCTGTTSQLTPPTAASSPANEGYNLWYFSDFTNLPPNIRARNHSHPPLGLLTFYSNPIFKQRNSTHCAYQNEAYKSTPKYESLPQQEGERGEQPQEGEVKGQICRKKGNVLAYLCQFSFHLSLRRPPLLLYTPFLLFLPLSRTPMAREDRISRQLFPPFTPQVLTLDLSSTYRRDQTPAKDLFQASSKPIQQRKRTKKRVIRYDVHGF